MIIIKTFEEYYAANEGDQHSSHAQDSESFCERVRVLQRSLVSELQQIGLKECYDFEISWDISDYYNVCGSILHVGALSSAIPRAVLAAFSTDSEPEYWLCDFSVFNFETQIGNEFYINGSGDVYILKIEGWEILRDRLSNSLGS